MKGFVRVSQTEEDEEAFNKYFSDQDEISRRMFEPLGHQESDSLNEKVVIPGTAEGFKKLEEARLKIRRLEEKFKKDKSKLIQARQRGLYGLLEAIMQALPYFEVKLTLASPPQVKLRSEYLDAEEGSKEYEELCYYRDFFEIVRKEVDREFEQFLKELLGL